MFVQTVKTEDIFDRLNSEAYSPEHIKCTRILKRSGLPLANLGAFVSKKMNNSIRGINGELDLPGSNIPMFRPADISGGVADPDSAPKLSKSFEAEHEKSRVYPGDLVLGIAGSVGCVGRVPTGAGFGNVNGSSARISTNNDHKSAYLLAYLQSRFGQSSLLRFGVGSVQKHLNLEDLPFVVVSNPNEVTQKYIGEKVRQAERLRAWAKQLRTEVDEVLDTLNLPTSATPMLVNRVSTERLDARLDPRPYRTHYIGLVDQIKLIENSEVSQLAGLASGCPVSSNDFVNSGEVPLIRIRNIGFDEFIDLDIGVNTSVYGDEVKYQAKENMIVLGMDGIFRAQFFLADELPMLVNQRVAMLTATDIRAELLTHWLNRPEGQMQLNQWAVKTTVEHTSLSDIGRVRIPRLNRDIEDELADKLLSARRAYRYSRFLTTSAKFLVEALIEGQLTEAELIVAEQALQTGNDQLDRSILSRLKIDGVDGKGQPLFSDLDELYRLLAQASQD